MQWVNEKLEQSGQNNEQSNKSELPEIIEEEADLEESISSDLHRDKNVKCEQLAIQNAKLRKENIILQNKIRAVEEELLSSSYIVHK